ncbi:MAG: translation initiation factor IF-2 [Candidatus Kerfeldbacteria bacterium]
MNVTELARKLKITTNELKDLLPKIGFDIGRKAIKVDDKSAFMIIDKIRNNPDIIEDYRREQLPEETEIPEEVDEKEKENIIIPSVITVRDFADLLKKPVATIIQELMKNGILANLNEQIDYETASIIAEDFGFTPLIKDEDESKESEDESTIDDLIEKDSKILKSRPPIVVVMGHVDHGKTQLLDTIRKTNVIAKESGGITQHIGAYQVTKNKRKITFIDTPGHEAFTAMRSRGARVADIAILIIAADDGIKPQTEEVIKIIKSAKLPFLVALNKTDKPEADVEKVKNQLAQKDLLPEDWGGKVICVPVSAKTGEGIDDLLEHLLLLADVEKDNILSDPKQLAIGTIIESHIDKGEGPSATSIVLAGTLKKGDNIQVGEVVGKIKFMKDYNGEIIDNATPSTPVKILGLKNIPEVGDILQVINSDQSLKKMMKKISHQKKVYQDKQNWQSIQKKEGNGSNKVLNIILKADAFGSLEAIIQSLEVLQTDDIKIKFIKQGLGTINDNDIIAAEKTKALIFGFNVKAENLAQEIAKEKDLTINLYSIIYDLTDHVKKVIDGMVEYKTEIVESGKAKVLAIFRSEKKVQIVGALVTKGKIELNTKARIIRDDKKIDEGEITKLQQSKQETKSIPSGTECGIQITNVSELKEGDIIETYKEEIIQ